MKTAILNSDGVVLNVGVGKPTSLAPEGLEFVVLEDDVWVERGCLRAADGSFYSLVAAENSAQSGPLEE